MLDTSPSARREYQIVMKINEGTVDRALRLVVGLGILSLTVVGPKTLWGLAGIVPVLTGAIGYCPLYSLIGINTRSTRTQKPAV